MVVRILRWVGGLVVMMFANGLLAQGASGGASAVVEVVTEPLGAAGAFVFTGVPDGTIAGGGRIEAADLNPGTYASIQLDAGPQFILSSITCDDQASPTPSVGNLLERTASFNLGEREIVSCVFTNRAQSSISESGSSSNASGSPAASGTNPFQSPDDGLEEFPIPDALPPLAGTFPAPRPGSWDVTNFAGQMACGAFNMPLTASREQGVLEVLDGGQTVVGTGFAEDTAQLRMQADAELTGRYAGAVSGEQDGIPMTIEFFWQLITDEWIVGYLTSQVSQPGMTCNMHRTFELRYVGP